MPLRIYVAPSLLVELNEEDVTQELEAIEFGSCCVYILPFSHPDVTVVLNFDINRCSRRMYGEMRHGAVVAKSAFGGPNPA